MLKVNNEDTTIKTLTKRRKICSELIVKTPERRSGAIIVIFEQISHLFVMFLLLAFSMYLFAG